MSLDEVAHAAALAAAASDDSGVLVALTERVTREDVQTQRALLSTLTAATAPNGAARAALMLIEKGDARVANEAARVLGNLVPVLEEAPAQLSAGVEAIARSREQRRSVAGRAMEQLGRSLLLPLEQSGVDRPELRAVIRDQYQRLDNQGRHLAFVLHRNADVQEIQELVDLALTVSAPAGQSDEPAVLLARAERAAGVDVPEALCRSIDDSWRLLQVRAAALRAEDSEMDLRELVDLLFSGRQEAVRRAVTALRIVATSAPERVTAELLGRPPPTAPGPSAALSSIIAVLADGLDGARRLTLYDWLLPSAAICVAQTSPALVRLASGHAARLQELLPRVALESPQVRHRVVDAAVKSATGDVIRAVEPQLRSLLTQGSTLNLALDGRLAPADAAALARLTAAALGGQSEAATMAGRNLVACLTGPDNWAPEALGDLLLAPSAYVAEMAATALNEGQQADQPVPLVVYEKAVQRLGVTDLPQLTRPLVHVLVGGAARREIDVEVALGTISGLLDKLRRGPDPMDEAGAWSQLIADSARMFGAAAAHRRAPATETRAAFLEYLTTVDIGSYPYVARVLVNSLASAGRTDPGIFDVATQAWGELFPAGQRAVCEAVAAVEGATRGGRLETLATLPSTTALARHAAQELLGQV
jgi:hypothetical protein